MSLYSDIIQDFTRSTNKSVLNAAWLLKNIAPGIILTNIDKAVRKKKRALTPTLLEISTEKFACLHLSLLSFSFSFMIKTTKCSVSLRPTLPPSHLQCRLTMPLSHYLFSSFVHSLHMFGWQVVAVKTKFNSVMTQRWDHFRFSHFLCLRRQQFWKQWMNIIIVVIIIIIIIIILLLLLLLL